MYILIYLQIVIVAGKNHGPSVAFRVYPHDAMTQYVYESCFFPENPVQGDEYSEILTKNVNYHKQIFDEMNGVPLSTSWVGSVSHSNYNSHGMSCAFPGEKVVFMNPRTGYEEIDNYIKTLSGLIKEKNN